MTDPAATRVASRKGDDERTEAVVAVGNVKPRTPCPDDPWLSLGGEQGSGSCVERLSSVATRGVSERECGLWRRSDGEHYPCVVVHRGYEILRRLRWENRETRERFLRGIGAVSFDFQTTRACTRPLYKNTQCGTAAGRETERRAKRVSIFEPSAGGRQGADVETELNARFHAAFSQRIDSAFVGLAVNEPHTICSFER